MTNLSALLARRREQLIAKSSLQRQALSSNSQNLTLSLARIETGLRLVNRLRHNPILIGGLAAYLIGVKPQRLIGLINLLQTASTVWQLWQRLLLATKKSRRKPD